MAIHNENVFEDEVIADLRAMGWQVGDSQSYNTVQALYPPDIIAYIRATQPDQWDKVKRLQKTDALTEREILKTLVKEVDRVSKTTTQNVRERHGVLSVLRHGFKCLGATFKMMQAKPNGPTHSKQQAIYEQTLFRVVPQLYYSKQNQNSIDLVLFVNGLPTATVELKTDFTQSVQHAITQYKTDRLTQNERLLTFKTGAMVHFALSGDACYMTTKLAGKDTFFLPFNRGHDGGAGNPPNSNGYPTAYVWQQLWHPENWLNILQNYIHMDIDGKGKEILIFPRFHQWDVVQKITSDIDAKGVGNRYLVQHSAGSGKTKSIAWLAHKLANQYDGANHRFASVIVITDRTILDEQLRADIEQLDPTAGTLPGTVVKSVVRTSDSSKSKKLARFLDEGARIIVTTLQTFPFAMEHLASNEVLKNKNFAIIADEAHSSQSGGTVRNIYKNLKSYPDSPFKDGDTIQGEDFITYAYEQGHTLTGTDNLSLFAFTATPKDKTIQIFGTLPNPKMPPSDDNIPQAFHHYTMKQAIAEGFILNVLQNHAHYETLYRLSTERWADDRLLKERKGEQAIKKWVKAHPTSIGEKVAVIVEHFMDNVAHLLDGQAKAMVVTSSRQNVVRYKQAFDQYLKREKITNIQALVAFSGTVTDNGSDYTETSMNGDLNPMGIADAFDTDQYNILLVANKFQTGFDQPKLVAMYVDKQISNIECVQTLSRLNRAYPNKDKTFIVDFENKTDDVVASFAKYYKHTKLKNVSNPNHVYEIMQMLLDEGIFDTKDVEKFYNLYAKKQVTQAMLYTAMQRPADIFKNRHNVAMQALKTAQHNKDKKQEKQAEKDLSTLNEFKKRLSAFVNYYDFIGQVVDLQDTELEKQRLFCKHFAKFIATAGTKQDIDITGVQLDLYRIKARQPENPELPDEDGTLIATNAVGTGTAHSEDEKRLAEIISKINEIFGGNDWTAHAPYMDKIVEQVTGGEDEKSKRTLNKIIQSNGDYDQVLKDPHIAKHIENAVIDDIEKANIVFSQQQKFNELLVQYVYQKHNNQR